MRSDSPQDHTLDPEWDEDYVTLSLSAGEQYILETSGLPETNTVLTLYDTDGMSVLATDDDGGEGSFSRIEWNCPISGTYYAKVEGYGGMTTGAYTLTLSLPEMLGPDAYEMDDDPFMAQPLNIDSPQDHTLDPEWDEDYVTLSLSAGEQYILETSGASETNTVLTLYDTDGMSVLATDDDGGEGFFSRIEWNCPISGTYYAKVEGYGGMTTGAYTLTLSLPEMLGPDAYEMDDDPFMAQPINIDSPQDRTLDPEWDEDYVTLSLSAGEQYILETSGAFETNTVLTLYDTDGMSVLATDDDGGEGSFSRIEWNCPVSGTYYAKVAVSEGYPSGAYTLALTLAPVVEADLYEPDDDVLMAQSLSIDSSQDHTLDREGDVDYVMISMIAGEQYVLETSGIVETDTTLTLYDTDGVTMLAFDDNTVGLFFSRVSWMCEVSGVYYAKVAGFGGTATGPYTLTFKHSGNISGTAYDDYGNPLTSGGYVNVHVGDPCGSNTWVGKGDINVDGTYVIEGLPVGNYYLKARSWSSPVFEWWAEPASSPDCSLAEMVTVTEGTVTGKDFQLD